MNTTTDKNWWGRNWKWCAPLCALGGLVVFASFFALVLTLVFGMMKSSPAYEEALAQTQNNALVQEAIGQPIEAGLLVTGSINTSGSSGNADLAIPISGPKGKATIFLKAQRNAGNWTYSTLAVRISETREVIDLLEQGDKPET